jgi:peptidoglycan/xylan/chitin deacetylase (PgdA/CDA1 family)
VIVLPSSAHPPPHSRLALKIDVQTYRGMSRGVPRLLDVLTRHDAKATFFFALGPEHSGRWLLRSGPRGALRRLGPVTRLGHYGFETILYGTALPAPDIGRRCAELMCAVRAQGHDVGIHAWDVALWRSHARDADARWTRAQMERAVERFESVLGERARAHAAPGWQMNVHGFRLTQRLGFDYACDTRGTRPFVPVLHGELVACPQVPTTLPTLEELLECECKAPAQAVERLLASQRAPAPEGHVYNVSAEYEGGRMLDVFEQLLEAWCGQGIVCMPLRTYLEAAGVGTLPRHRVEFAPLAPGGPVLACQGGEFLA